MATKTLNLRIAQKYDTREAWGKSQLVLLKGELALDEKGTYKVGNGSATWSSLPFAGSATVHTAATAPTGMDTDYDLGQLWFDTSANKYYIRTQAGWDVIIRQSEMDLKANAADVFNKTEITDKLALKANVADAATKTETEAALKLKANAADVFNKTEITDKLALKADSQTVTEQLALKANVADAATKTETDAALALKADKETVEASLALKANSADVFNKTEIGNKLDLKANSADVFNKTEINDALALKANVADAATKTETTASLALKANAADVFNKTEITEKLALKADLQDGKIPASQLPSYVDDVLEFENKAGFPVKGEAGIIYVAKDTNIVYRWGGSEYVEISASLALGENSSTAFAGDRGVALEGKMTTVESRIAQLKALSNKDTIATADIDDKAVTNAKIDTVSLDKLVDAETGDIVLSCGNATK